MMLSGRLNWEYTSLVEHGDGCMAVRGNRQFELELQWPC